MTSPQSNIRYILNPEHTDEPPAPATPPPLTTSGGGQGTIQITPDAVKAVATVVTTIGAEVAVMCKPAGDDSRAAAAGLSGWATQNALNYMADKIEHQSASLLQRLSDSADKLTKSADSYAAADAAAAGQAGG